MPGHHPISKQYLVQVKTEKGILGKIQQLRGNQINDLGSILRFSVLNDMLRHIIPILILDKCIGTNMEFLQQRSLCSLVAVLEHPLDHTTTVRMSGKSMDLTVKCLDDELYMFGGDSLNGFLDYVVSVLIFDTFQNMTIQFFD